MPYVKDKVADIVAVLKIMRKEFNRQSGYKDTTELRKEAVQEFAGTQLRAKRFKNQDSANKTIHDACARRLKPDVDSIRAFDKFADEWLRRNSSKLKGILLKHSEFQSQRAMVNDFFDELI